MVIAWDHQLRVLARNGVLIVVKDEVTQAE
jgi:hypothetical protein